MKTAERFVLSLGFFLITAAVLLSVIDFCCFDRSFYTHEYQKNDAMQGTGMSLEDLESSTDVLLNYLRNHRDDIVTYARVDGRERAVFNERETLHMKDVKNLYQKAVLIRNLMLITGAFMIVLFHKKNSHEIRHCYQNGAMATIACVIFIAIAALADFQTFWYHFHDLFFNNRLWLLDPNTSIMINMFPGTFFFDLVVRIIMIYLILLIAFTYLIFRITGIRKPKRNDSCCSL